MPSPKISKSQVVKKISKYNALWPSFANDLEIEMACIRAGGSWEKDGKKQGNGLAFHYNEMRKILWPRLDDHRWNQLCLKEAVASKALVIMGAASTSKTHFAAWFSLCDYYCFPNETCVLISSTDLRGLELRVWAEIKTLHEEAQATHDVPGHLLETKHAISTDDISEDEVRDLRRGLIGIPCIQNGKFVGLGKYCFCAGSMVDTPNGRVPIETIKEGDIVLSAIGPNRVAATSSHIAQRLVTLHLSNGETINCTPDHPFLTQWGFVNAIDISPAHRLVSVNETLRIMWDGIKSRHSKRELLQPEMQTKVQTSPQTLPCLREDHRRTTQAFLQSRMPNIALAKKVQMVRKGFHSDRTESDFLFSLMLWEMEDVTTRYRKKNDCWKRPRSGRKEYQQGNSFQQEGNGKAKETWARIRKKQPLEEVHFLDADCVRNDCVEYVPRSSSQFPSQYRPQLKVGTHSSSIQDRCRISKTKARSGNRRKESRPIPAETKRSKEGFIPDWIGVDRITVFQPSSASKYGEGKDGYRVYNLEIDGHPTFSVNGVVVHNCGIKQKRMRLIADEAQFCNGSFLSAFANLDKNVDFRFFILGNPQDILDPLGKAAEPKDGWGSHMEPDKTSVWDTRFMNGRCVNLIGTDSPNFDYPADQPTKFPYLISREKIANTISFFPQDSTEYYSQCIGSMKIGQMIKRVLTRDLCRQFLATSQDVVWDGPTTKICGLDAAYGGDRCVAGHVEFGKNVEGKTIILIRPPLIVPIRVNSEKQPEDQIAEWVKEYCRKNSIPPENFFHDSTGRGSLGTALARVWSAQCNPIEFGGSPTTRPVSLDLYIWDQSEKRRRLKRCDEHYSKFVTELWFSVRYAVEAGQVRGLPEDVMDEFCMREWKKVRSDKIELEKKEDMKERVGRSPDLADFVACSFEGARQRGFQISRLANSEAERKSLDWLRDLADKATTHTTHELIYS